MRVTLLFCSALTNSLMVPSDGFVVHTRAISSSRWTNHRPETSPALGYKNDDYEAERKRIEMTNNFLKESRASFKNVEALTDNLLTHKPLLAATIFVGLGLIVAYISGFFMLGGYIESLNPVDNDMVPYWEEVELSDEMVEQFNDRVAEMTTSEGI